MSEILSGYQSIKRLHSSERFIITRAIRLEDQTPVILKQLQKSPSAGYDAEAQRLLQHEYEILTGLNIPGIITPISQEASLQPTSSAQTNAQLSSHPQDRAHGLTTVFYDHNGISLRQLLQQKQYQWHQWLPIAVELSQLLGKLHNQQIIHKQISPSNLLLNTASGAVQIIDFSQASRLEREQPQWQGAQLKAENLPYIAPEQTGRINRSIDYRTDFYSLGATLYELMTGRPPFSSKDRLELIHRHIAKQPKAPHLINPELPETLSHIILKLLAKDASLRYQSSYGLTEDLQTCLDQWQQDGAIQHFKLATRDLPERFVLPQKLYGRNKTIKALIKSYDQNAQGEQNVVLISGYAGVGKSSLVHEIRQYVNEHNGHFVSGKFAQFGRNRPYAAILQALQSLIRQLLTEPEARVSNWRNIILDALGDNAQVLTKLIPELELIIGPQPIAPKLPPAEEKNRFSRIFQRLLQVFATQQRPLVLFLDDLHWADLSSIYLIESLARNNTQEYGTPSYLMLIGSYRDEEVSRTHPLAMTIEKLRQLPISLNEQQLLPLSLSQINQLLADTLCCPLQACQDLAKICLDKTQGNPFFLNQFLTALQDEGLIYFNQNGWYWDKKAIQAQAMSDNVVDLMVSKIQRLSQSTQRVLRLASCIGSPFSLRTLSIVNEHNARETATHLWQALSERLIIPMDDNYRLTRHLNAKDIEAEDVRYRFVHDRVQQAAYSLLSKKEKQQLHLQIGQLLLESLPETELDSRTFEITNHLNQSHELLKEPQQREQLAEMNLKAGELSRNAAAFGAAFEYFQNGLQMLDNGWQDNYPLALALNTQAAEAAFIQADFEQMQHLIEQVQHNAQHLLDQVRVYELQIQAHISRNHFDLALEAALNILHLLGVDIPKKPSKIEFWRAFFKTRWLIKQNPKDKVLNSPEISDPYIKAALPIMASMFGVVKFSSSGLRPMVMAKQVELSIQYGLTPSSAQAFAGYGGVLCGQFGQLDRGYKLGQIALAIDKQLPSRLTHHKTLSLFDSYVRHWKEPLSNTLDSLEYGHQLALDCGDIEWGAYCLAAYIQYQFPLAESLATAQPRLNEYMQQIQLFGQKQSEYYSRYTLQSIDNLRGLNHNPILLDGRYNQEEQMLALHEKNNHRTAVCMHHFYKALLCYLFGHYEAAEEHCQKGTADLASIGGTYTTVWFQFISAMTQLALIPSSNVLQHPKRFSRVQSILKRVKHWAKHSPINQEHRIYLIQAEMARVQKRYNKAMALFEQAIQYTQQAEIPMEKALAYELAARLYRDWKKPVIADAYIRLALQRYRDWGATAKVDQLIETYQLQEQLPQPRNTEQLPNREQNANNNQILDILSVMRASHAIADEIVLERLLGRLMTLALENAGGQRAILALRRDDELFIEAEADLHDAPRFFTGLSVDNETEKLPVNIVHYVHRTKETVVLSNALEHEMFMHDSYIRQREPRSLLCMPILYHGDLTAILYLENRESADVFTRERLETLQILSAQAAISIENAKLYLSLQQSEQEFRSLFENAVEGIFRTTQHGLFLSVNPALAHLLGYYSPDDFLKHISNVQQGCFKDPRQQKRFIHSLTKNHQIRNFEAIWLQANAKPVEISISARSVLNDKGQVLYYEGSVTDIGERKNREKAEKAHLDAVIAQEKAEASSEAKSQFLATMSHEIRTPMNGILGMAQLLMRSELNSEQKKQIQNIYQSGQSLLAILNDVLDFTKVEAGQVELDKQPFSLQKTVSDLVTVIQPLTDEKALKFNLELDLDLPQWVHGDQRVLNQILMNLCANAVKFTDQGYICLRLKSQPEIPVTDSHNVHIEHNQQEVITQNRRIRFEVEDTGIGIDKESHCRIFQHFSQADSSITRRFGGTGLGLSICKQLVELQEGEIGFDSEADQGCLFWFELNYPVITTPELVKTDTSTIPVEQTYDNKKEYSTNRALSILLVEDTEINQEVAAGLLESDNHRVDVAEDGYTALSLHNDNDYDLVLMDIHLPDMDGMETTRRIRQHKDPVKAAVTVIALTAALTQAEQQKYQKSGMDDVLAKPLQYHQLLNILQKHQLIDASQSTATGEESNPPLEIAIEEKPILEGVNQTLIEQHITMLGAERFTELFESFKSQFTDLQQQLDHTVKSEEYADASKLAHRMAGSCANFGLERLGLICKQIEQDCQKDTVEKQRLLTNTQELKTSYQEGLEQTENFLT